MTNPPDHPNLDSGSVTPTENPVEAAPPFPAPPRPESDGRASEAAPPALDEGTYDGVLEPRSANRLPLGDGTWHQISPKYVVAQFIGAGIVFALVVAATLVLALVFGQTWAWWPGIALIVVTVVPLIILPRQARAYGYQLRADDLVFRRGILWQRMIAVPYGRLQLVDITHGPLDRALGIAQLKLVTAAAATGVSIPGLPQDAAESLRDTLIDVAETRRTGL